MTKLNLINTAIAITLILSIGLITGYTLGFYEANRYSFPNIKTVAEINPGISTIKLLEVRNGELIGKVSGRNARLAYSPEKILELGVESYFKVPLSEINLKDFYATQNLPENTRFIASISGKYYYHVLDKRAFNITPKNRLYFSSSEEAKSVGYLEAN